MSNDPRTPPAQPTPWTKSMSMAKQAVEKALAEWKAVPFFSRYTSPELHLIPHVAAAIDSAVPETARERDRLVDALERIRSVAAAGRGMTCEAIRQHADAALKAHASGLPHPAAEQEERP